MSAPGFIREMQENVVKYGCENTTTLLMVQAIKEIQSADAEIDQLKAANAELAKALESMVANFDYDGQITREVRAIERANAALANHNKGQS